MVSARAQDADSARVWLRSLYAAYTHNGKGIQYDARNAGRWFTPSLVALMRADDRAVGTDMPVYADGDVVCGCQDWDGIWDLKIDVRMQSTTRATADVSLTLAQPPVKENQRRLRFDLLARAGHWRIDDACDLDQTETWCLRKAMQEEIRNYGAHPEWKRPPKD